MNETHDSPKVLEVDWDEPSKPELLVLSPQERINFEGHIDMTGGPDACWPWMGSRISTGYGNLGLRKKTQKAHRVAYRLWRGPVPEGLHVLHRCDNPPCCNPAHLWLGTIADNAADKYAKGRANPAKGDKHSSRTHPEKCPRGENHGRAKVNEKQVVEMRLLYAAGGITYPQLAERFGISRAVAWFAVNRWTWKHVP